MAPPRTDSCIYLTPALTSNPLSRLFYFSILSSSAPLNRPPSAFGISSHPLTLLSPSLSLSLFRLFPLYHGTHVLINSQRRVRDVHVPLHERL